MSKDHKIRPLADHVINQIAAGEVVERPASIVKELVENSLDAGATSIIVELEAGGIDRIRIRDNGRGIPADQLDLALSRHCTSKLVDTVDLQSIGSLGFRGEALASIAAVSELSCTSRTALDAHGWQTDAQSGREFSRPKPQSHAIGTTIEVRDLFANIPARRRFLKQPRTEFIHSQQFIRRAGFCYPNVSLTLFHDGRRALSMPGADDVRQAQRRWYTLFGAEFMQLAVPIDADLENLVVSGWVGDSAYSRQGSDLQYIVVNRRVVRDRHVAHAVRMAYEGMIAPGRHAAYALHLTTPSENVDVNVHPGKAEVRFRDPRTIHDIIYACVKRALSPASDPQSEVQNYLPTSAMRSIPQEVEEPRSATFSRASGRQASRVGAALRSDVENNLLAVVDNRFAICRSEAGVTILDVHEAVFAIASARLASGETGTRPLLIPETFDTSPSDDELQDLQSLGIEFNRLSTTTAALRATPVVVNDIDLKKFGAYVLANFREADGALSAIARAAANAFTTPGGLNDQRIWYGTLCDQLIEFDLDPDNFCIHLGSDDLVNLFTNKAS